MRREKKVGGYSSNSSTVRPKDDVKLTECLKLAVKARFERPEEAKVFLKKTIKDVTKKEANTSVEEHMEGINTNVLEYIIQLSTKCLLTQLQSFIQQHKEYIQHASCCKPDNSLLKVLFEIVNDLQKCEFKRVLITRPADFLLLIRVKEIAEETLDLTKNDHPLCQKDTDYVDSLIEAVTKYYDPHCQEYLDFDSLIEAISKIKELKKQPKYYNNVTQHAGSSTFFGKAPTANAADKATRSAGESKAQDNSDCAPPTESANANIPLAVAVPITECSPYIPMVDAIPEDMSNNEEKSTAPRPGCTIM